jgi:hypothetical protein
MDVDCIDIVIDVYEGLPSLVILNWVLLRFKHRYVLLIIGVDNTKSFVASKPNGDKCVWRETWQSLDNSIAAKVALFAEWNHSSAR